MSLAYEDESGQPDNGRPQAEEWQPRQPYYTIVLLALIIAVFLAQLAAGLEPSILAAGFVKPFFLHRGEYWRILTGASVHGSLVHVVMNGFAFWSFGKIFEMLSNRAHLAIVFLLSAIGGGVMSVICLPDGTSVGASGGIVGLVSYLTIYAFRRRQFVSKEFRKSLLINIGFILVFGLVLFQVIDNFGHIGGLLTGAIYGLIQIPTDEQIDPLAASSAIELAGLGALGAYAATCVFSILLILHLI